MIRLDSCRRKENRRCPATERSFVKCYVQVWVRNKLQLTVERSCTPEECRADLNRFPWQVPIIVDMASQSGEELVQANCMVALANLTCINGQEVWPDLKLMYVAIKAPGGIKRSARAGDEAGVLGAYGFAVIVVSV